MNDRSISWTIMVDGHGWTVVECGSFFYVDQSLCSAQTFSASTALRLFALLRFLRTRSTHTAAFFALHTHSRFKTFTTLDFPLFAFGTLFVSFHLHRQGMHRQPFAPAFFLPPTILLVLFSATLHHACLCCCCAMPACSIKAPCSCLCLPA